MRSFLAVSLLASQVFMGCDDDPKQSAGDASNDSVVGDGVLHSIEEVAQVAIDTVAKGYRTSSRPSLSAASRPPRSANFRERWRNSRGCLV